ncbi:MAG: hypothetical protein HYX27_21800 [Acidobacteria bacterium]|nr:hypothetical protein [Acidobacteriota bacterium]
MRVFPLLWSLGLTAAALSAQSAGVPPEWETRKLLDSLVNNAKKLEPLVSEITPASWKEKGAPDAYQAQWKSVKLSLEGLRYSSARLANEPTRLSFALDTLFRLDGLNIYLGSLASGVRRYQNPALADLLLGVADENSANRESLKQYALDLAASKEGELKVMETEAQRCLGIIVKQPPAPARPKPAPAKDKDKERK